MSKHFRSWDPKQKWLLPPEITEFIPEGHASHFVRNLFVEQLDLSAILETYVEERGFPPRGLAKVQAEWSLVCTAHNLLKLVRASS